MLQPDNKLPWTYSTNYEEILNELGNTIIETPWTTKKDREYIVQACNNFPKAVELLEKVKKDRGVNLELYLSIKEFLKSLEE